MPDAQAVIDLKAIKANAKAFKRLFPLMAVVKADAYGHGSGFVAKTIEEDSSHFAVATAKEAIQLRESGIKKPILVLCSVKNEDMEELFDLDVAFTVSSIYDIGNLPDKAKIHLKINTGLNRLGIQPDETPEFLKLIDQKRLQLEGIYTHLIDSEEINPVFSLKQINLFRKIIKTHKISTKYLHFANTGGAMNPILSQIGQELGCNLARIGIGLYGYSPNPQIVSPIHLKPAMEVKAWVMLVKTVDPGDVVSYGATWMAKKRTKLATIRFGYADGYHRSLSNRGKILVNGQICSVVGRVCMDQIVVDVDKLDLEPGSTVQIFSRDTFTAQNLSELMQTNVYEVLTSISQRVERIYIDS